MNRQRFLLPALLVLTVARLLMLPFHELSAAETHALDCARHTAPWHHGLGPLLPLLVKLSTALCGTGALGVRLFAPLLMLAAGWLLWELARGLFDATTASWALVLFHVTPAVNVASVSMTLTTLGIAASLGVLAALRHALHRSHRWHLHWWLLGGALFVAFLADWRFIMLAASVVAGMALTPRGRRALLKWPVLPVLSLSMGVALTVFFAWNSEHRWPAFAPLPPAQPVALLRLVLHVSLALSPLLLAAHAWSLGVSALRRPMGYAVTFLYAFAWPLVSLDLLSWNALPWPHCGTGAWIAPASILLAHHTLTYEPASPQVKRWTRGLLLLFAAVQSCWMLQAGLPAVLGAAS